MTPATRDECERALASISAYLDGELEPTACEAIESHCQDCPSCAAVVDGLRTTIGLCREAAAAPIPEPVRRKAQEQVAALLKRSRQGSG